MSNPYRDKPDYCFWRQGVSELAASAVDPVVRAPFSIGRDDRVAAAGSCFAQHISRALAERDLDIVGELRRGFGHNLMGIYAEVAKGGEIALGAALTLRP